MEETTVIQETQFEAPKKKKRSFRSKKRYDLFVMILSYVLIALLSITFLLPFLFMVSSSFKEYAEIKSLGLNLIPKNPTVQNYVDLFKLSEDFNLLRGFLNTCIIVIPSTIIGILSSALAAFAFAKIPFKGRNTIFFLFIATMAIPGIIMMIPSYILYSKLHWVGTWLPMMIPAMTGGAATVFFTRQYMRGIPKSMEEAALIDGLSWWGIFWRIELPLARPILISNFIFGFIGGYNDWLSPALYLAGADKDMKTLQLIISEFSSSTGADLWVGIQMAASVIALVPTFIIFIAAQKQLLNGVNLNGGKDA